MLSDNMKFETNDSLEDASFKSCFARSVVVNSQHSKNFSNERHSKKFNNNSEVNEKKNGFISSTPIPTKNRNEKIQKDTLLMEHLHNSVNDIGYPTGSSRIVEVPVENVFSKSQIETLEWQLKQTEASREMYRAVMMQVVKFLERAHHSLRILGLKLNEHSHTLPRSKHELSLPRIQEHDFLDESSFMSSDLSLDCNSTIKSETWKKSKKFQPSSDEMLPEKLSQEAFMLLRTAESLLNTRAPDLTHANVDKDLKFLTQLSKEFPSVDDRLSQEGDFSAISVNNTDVNFNKSQSKDDSSSLSNTSSKSAKLNSLDNKTETKTRTFQVEVEKTETFSPSSASSAEDESGFSSITSFQDLGIPITYSILTEETDKLAENALKNKIFCKEPKINPKIKTQKPNLSELKLWNIKQDNSLGTVLEPKLNDGKPLKVLWV